MDEAMAAAIADVSARERTRWVRDLRRRWLRDLGWTVVNDSVVFAPDEDVDEASTSYSLASAARVAGLPTKLEDLVGWEPDRRPSTPAPTQSPEPGLRLGRPWVAPVATQSEARTLNVAWDAEI